MDSQAVTPNTPNSSTISNPSQESGIGSRRNSIQTSREEIREQEIAAD